MSKIELRYCKECLMPESRPRISFDENGVCNACQWAKEKKTNIDWNARGEELAVLCKKFRSPNGFDCIVPVSGGKDSSYVAYKMKHDLNMNVLAITITPDLQLEVGKENLENFIEHGYDHIKVTPNPIISRKINKIGFVEQGRPLLGWQIAVQATIFRMAVLLRIPFVMFGEDGEAEYGGSSKLQQSACYDVEHSIKVYLEGNDPKRFLNIATEKELYWWMYPSADEMRELNLSVAHWSYFENWDPYEHYLLSKDKCGLKEVKERSLSTYNNFAQTDTCLYDLHTFLMYAKFGFGRCSQDVGIDIRRGAMTRKQALALAQRFDGEYSDRFVPQYLEYFDLTRKEFDSVIDKHTNKELFEKINGVWTPKFEMS